MTSHHWTFRLTLKVDLLHYVLGLDALLLVVDEDLALIVLRPAVLVHPNFHLCVCIVVGRDGERAFQSELNRFSFFFI